MTGLMGGGMESWKLPCVLFTLMLCIGSNGEILPDYSNGLSEIGIQDPKLQDVSDVVLSACASVFEMYQMFISKTLLYGDVDTLAYLMSNARYHHLRLAMLFKILSKYKDGDDWTGAEIPWKQALGGNKFHLLQHMVAAKRDLGADTRISDTEMCEQMHIPSIREPFAASNKQVVAISPSPNFHGHRYAPNATSTLLVSFISPEPNSFMPTVPATSHLIIPASGLYVS